MNLEHGHTKHGKPSSPTHSSWKSMISRCYWPKATGYHRYGGRGITVCERWRGDDGFANFLADMGERPPGRSIDRFPDPDGNYELSNCRWGTRREQSSTMSTVKMTDADALAVHERRARGETAAAIADDFGVTPVQVNRILTGARRPHVAAEFKQRTSHAD